MTASRLIIPLDLKPITPFIRKAEDLTLYSNDVQSKIVAYHCRKYAAQLGIQILSSFPEEQQQDERLVFAKKILYQIVNSLEIEKQSIPNYTKEEYHAMCQRFALEVFNKADVEERSGHATKETAKKFHAAAIFLKMLDQFEHENRNESHEQRNESDAIEEIHCHLVDDYHIKQKWKYARWKTLDILKTDRIRMQRRLQHDKRQQSHMKIIT